MSIWVTADGITADGITADGVTSSVVVEDSWRLALVFALVPSLCPEMDGG
jgi:hypothetical protein